MRGRDGKILLWLLLDNTAGSSWYCERCECEGTGRDGGVGVAVLQTECGRIVDGAIEETKKVGPTIGKGNIKTGTIDTEKMRKFCSPSAPITFHCSLFAEVDTACRLSLPFTILSEV